MKKIGRNDPCPCKSGKKYKFCCLLKGVVYPQSNSIEKSNSVFSINNYFKLYNTFDLLSTLGALSLEPGNHGKYLRINYLLWEAVICNSNSNKIIHPNELNTVLSKHFGDNVMEDPPENIFTENVTCSAGNKTVFGGNFEQGVFTLNLIIKVTNYFRESIPTELLNKIYPAQHILLFLSDIIAVRVGHVKNIKGDNENSSELIFPKDLERYKESLWFERSLLIKYCDDLNLDIEGIKPFILKIEDLEENNANIQSIEENPISTKPIIELEHGYLVISPSNIVQALVHFTFAQAEMYGCLQIFLNEFHRLVWHELMFYLKNIGFENIKYSFNSNEKILFKPSLFKFDENKYALLIFCADNGTHYNSLTPFQDDLSSQGLFTSGSYSTLINGIKFNFPSCTLLQMNVYSSIGRSYILFGKNNKEEYSFITTAYQLICLLKSGDFDNFTLWNFERAKKMLLRDVMVMPMNFIDLFTLYQNKNNSFYLNDEKRPTHLFIPPGSGIELIYKAVIREDPMVAYYNSVEFTYPILLPVIKVNDYILRYASWEKNSDYIEYFLPDFPFDLWVRSGKMKENMIIIEYKTYWEFNEAICYWLLEVRNDLHKHLEPLPNLVITITHDFNDSFFDDQFILENKNNNLADEIIITANKDFINIKIPKTIDKYIRKPDNEGERILLSKLLEGFGMLLEINNLKNTLDTITILEILDVKAPLGLKKMLLLLNTNIDIAFDPRYLIEKRYLQEGNRQIIIDEEIPRLGSKCPRPGDFLSKEQKLKLTRDLVFEVHLKNLREILSEYNSVDLIKYFMSLNESLVHELSLIRIRTPTREKCFKDKEDIVNKLVNQINLSDETTLAVRCLIEHLAAEPTMGNKIINTQTIDDLISIMSLIIFWGGVGDQINHELFEVSLQILPSKRIGTNSREITDEFFSHFSSARIKEFIEDATDTFSNNFAPKDVGKKRIPQELDNAFMEEFGISLYKLGGIMDYFSSIALEQKTTNAFLIHSEATKEIRNHFNGTISEQEIEASLQLLSLKNRGTVQNLPTEKGFDNNDISPWRYNRRLSYLQRPIVFIDYGLDKDSPKIYWTPRHMNLSSRILTGLLISGRFKAPHKSKLEKKISKFSQSRRLELQTNAFMLFNSKSSDIVVQEIGIGLKCRFRNKEELGDIDILIIDNSLRAIFSIECKRTEPARNSKEMIEEVEKYLNPNNGYFKKHQRRHEWLDKNRDAINSEFGVDVSEYLLHSFFVTNEALSINFMKKRIQKLKIYSMYELKDKSMLDILNMCSN